jgi:uncharacterized protein involved in exopolysaccharide biosynthesis
MSEAQTKEHLHGAQASAGELSVFDLMMAVARHKKLLVRLPVAAAIVTALASLALPDVYKATTKLMPPQQSQSSATALLAQLGGVAGMAAGIGGLKNPNDLYVGMLQSRTVADKLVAQFDLKKVYDTDSQEKARKRLENNTTISSGKDGLITIEVEDQDRKAVARMANAYVSELLQLTKVLAVTEASQRRMFFERQLEGAKNNLAKAEFALKGSLDTGGVISVDAESTALVATVARLRAQASAKEIELNAMRAFVTATHPDFRRVEQELSSLRAELSKLENGRGANNEAARDGKDAGFESIKLLRDVKYYQMLYELLAKQYEIARLDEAKEPSIVQVLDPAVEPERRVKPKRRLLVLGAAAGGFVVALMLALASAVRQRALQAPDTSAQLRQLKEQWRGKQAGK